MREIDLALSWEYEYEDMLFVESVRRECRARRMKSAIILKDNVRHVTDQLKSGALRISLLLDMLSEPASPRHLFTKLCYAVKDAGGMVVNDPDHAKNAIDKSITHFDLVRAGITVPPTVILRDWESAKNLSARQKKELGVPFVIKPALGYAQRGVNLEARGRRAEILRVKKSERGDNILLQKKVSPIMLGERPAWFRVFFILTEIIPCWWNPHNGIYTHVSIDEMSRHRLFPLAAISSDIARLKNMEWFSSEVALETAGKRRRFVAIDYVNDQFDLRAKSRYGAGLPDDVVKKMAVTLVETAWARSRGIPYYPHRTIFLSTE